MRPSELHRKINNRADRDAGRALGEPGFPFVNPAGGGDVEMNPWSVLGKFLDEPCSRDRATPFAGAGVADVRDGALDQFLVILIHGHGPHFFTHGLRALKELIEVFARRAERADVDAAERYLDRAS